MKINLIANRYNQKWTRSVQNLIYSMLLTTWLGGLGTESRPGELGRLLRIEEVGEILAGSLCCSRFTHQCLINHGYSSRQPGGP